MKEKYLPIGTVCRLKDGNKYLMIIGFCQSPGENPNVVYDYNGCMYPEGVISPEINFLFNHNQIEEILYDGLVNEEELSFKAKLKEFLETGKIDGKEINIDENGNVTLGDGKVEQNNITDPKQVVNETLNAVQTQQQNLSSSVVNNQFVNNSITQQSQSPNIPIFSTLNLNQQDNNQ